MEVPSDKVDLNLFNAFWLVMVKQLFFDLYSWIDNTSAKCIALMLFVKSKRKKS